MTAEGLAGEFPAPKTLGAAGSLPEVLEPIVGRDGELTELSEVLARGHRLVTLTGPGGTGKTRLATAATAAVAGLGPTVIGLTGLADGGQRDTVTAAFPAQLTDSALLQRCAQVRDADNAPAGRPFDGARVVQWEASAAALYSVVVSADGRHWAMCALFAPPAKFPGRSTGTRRTPLKRRRGLGSSLGAAGFVFLGRFPAEVARVEWSVDGHIASQVTDDGFVVIVLGQVTATQP